MLGEVVIGDNARDIEHIESIGFLIVVGRRSVDGHALECREQMIAAIVDPIRQGIGALIQLVTRHLQGFIPRLLVFFTEHRSKWPSLQRPADVDDVKRLLCCEGGAPIGNIDIQVNAQRVSWQQAFRAFLTVFILENGGHFRRFERQLHDRIFRAIRRRHYTHSHKTRLSWNTRTRGLCVQAFLGP